MAQLIQGLIDQGWRLVDVRTDAEWAQGRVAGAHHVPMDQVVEQIGAHTEQPLLIMCASGGRSYRVAPYDPSTGSVLGSDQEVVSLTGIYEPPSPNAACR